MLLLPGVENPADFITGMCSAEGPAAHPQCPWAPLWSGAITDLWVTNLWLPSCGNVCGMNGCGPAKWDWSQGCGCLILVLMSWARRGCLSAFRCSLYVYGSATNDCCGQGGSSGQLLLLARPQVSKCLYHRVVDSWAQGSLSPIPNSTLHHSKSQPRVWEQCPNAP